MMKKKLYRLLACLVCICLTFGDFSLAMGLNAQKMSAASAFPSDEDFESSPLEDVPNPVTIGDWTFSLLKADGTLDEGAENMIDDEIDSNDKMLDLFGPLANKVVVKSNAGAFKLDSIKLNNEDGPLNDLKIEGYKNGVLVQGAVENLTNLDSMGTVHLSGTAWQNIDEFRLKRQDEAANIWISIFSMDIDPPVESTQEKPRPPSIPVLDASSDTGASNSDNITSDDTPTLMGTAEVNSTVNLLSNGVPIGTTSANERGDWSFTRETPLIEGIHTITATAANAGGTSESSAPLVITIDKNGPTTGVLSSSNITTSGVSLNWDKATDETTSKNELEYQVYLSTTSNFNTVDEVESGSPLGIEFSKDIDTFNVMGLLPNTTYYFNVLVKDAAGNKSVYSMKEVKTNSYATAPIVTTDHSMANVTATSVKVSGNVTSDGNVSITERGVVYSTTAQPTISENKVAVQGTTGTFTADLTNLNAKTKYFYRAFATNSVGTSYGEEREFTTKNNVATLIDLSVAPFSLNKHFESDTIDYSATVPYGTTEVPVTAIAADSNAMVHIVGASNGKLTLDEEGTTDIRIEVTAEDGTVKAYTIVVTKAQLSANADLSNLTISTGQLNPNFDKDTVNYTATVPSSTTDIVVTPTLDDSKAKVKLRINDQPEIQHQPIYLNEGKNVIDIIATAEDQSTTKTYTVIIYKLRPAPAVTANDVNNVIVGIDNSMEYQINDGIWTTFNLVNSPDLSGDKTVKVRYLANISNGEPVNEEATLNFTANTKTESALPNVTQATTEEDTISTSGLVITPAVQDSNDVTHYKISEITGGTLYKNDSTTSIENDGFITKAEGEAGLKFRPNTDANTSAGDTFSFKVQAALDGAGKGLSHAAIASINVTEVNDAPIAVHDQLSDKVMTLEETEILFEELLQNDQAGPENENGQTLTVVSVSEVTGGTAVIQDGKIIFTPSGTGAASFKYTIQDNGTTYGNVSPETASATVQFSVVSKPVIQLEGDNPIYIELGSQYTESGYNVTDEMDENLADQVIVTGSVNSNQLGMYSLKYNVVNSKGIPAVEVIRNVHVVSADLKALSVSSGNVTPSFDPAQLNYNLTVPSSTTSIDVSASTLDEAASATLNGETVGNSGGQSITLQPGVNTVSIVVIARGGMTKTYTMEITRELIHTEAPAILNQPADQTVSVGGEANLSVNATAANGELRYQWYSNTSNNTSGGTLIPGATNATYAAPTTVAGTTYYYVKVTNTDHSATGNQTAETTSEVAAVTVKAKSTNAYLGDLTLSSGVLSPLFTKNRETYTVDVPHSVTNITFTPVVEDIGKATVTVNGQPSTSAVPLTVGANIIQVVVTAEDGVTKNTYTITVNRAQPSSSGGGDGSTPAPQPGPTPVPQPTTEQIIVDVDGDNGSNLTKTPITRTTEPNGRVKDKVAMTDAIAKETVQKAQEQGVNTARIIIPDKEDKVAEVLIEIPKSALDELNNGNLQLEIVTPNAVVSISTKSLTNFNGNLYFRVVPIKSESEKQQVEDRAKNESLIQEAIGNNTVQVIGRPMEIETNMQSHEVTIVLPLTASLSANAAERENLLNNLGVYIEHSDGSKELIKGTVVKMQDGSEGLQFTVNKFSTFTMVYLEGWEGEATDEILHTPYIKGYGNNEFRPEAPVTRAQMATMLARNINAAPSTQAYADVPAKHGAYAEIMEVKGAGIMMGKSASTFDPNGTVTRAQMATVVYRWVQNQCAQDDTSYAGCAILKSIPAADFKDVKDSHWAKEAMYFTKAAGIMVGDSKGQFRPEENLTRAQAVKVLNRLFKRGPLTENTTPTFKDVPATHWAFSEIEEAAREHHSSLDIKE